MNWFFLHCMFLALLSKISWPHMHRLISGFSILFYWSICLVLVPYYLITVDLTYFKISKCDASSFILISCDQFGYSGSFVILYEFEDCFSYSCKNWHWNFDCFGWYGHLTILSLPINEHGMALHLSVSLFISFINIL